ncbi:unnamed protein product [Caenorhabditis auriculariae]|uniref:Ubiquitin-related modifier 1 homolog n=1 Tax=Caenorhabditis auriculariae TaxID=2777116 RepID=A0A8S1HNL9_9PELO|nr:unnamed protein product [Caenorhabditis auriculariae]
MMNYKVAVEKMSLNIKVEFSGGSEFLVDGKKVHQMTFNEGSLLRDVLKEVAEKLVTDKARMNLLFNADVTEVANGVITLINDCDTALLSEYDTPLEDGDTVTFVSTLHGG